MVYALDPGGAKENKVKPDARGMPVLGFGISFPHVDADQATKVRYVVNNVYWNQEFEATDAADEDEP